MKNKLYFLIASISAILFMSCTNNYPIEDKAWTCITQQFATLDIDLVGKQNAYENYLVEVGYLPEASGNGYRKALQKMKDNNEIVPPPLREDYKDIMEQYAQRSNPTPCLDSLEFTQTKMHQMQEKAADTLSQITDLNPDLIAHIMLNSYTEEDLDHPFYRYTFLASMGIFEERDAGIARQSPASKDGKSPPSIAPRNLILITVTDTDQLLFNGEPIELTDLRKTVTPYIKGNPADIKFPEKELKSIAPIGEVAVSKAVVSVRNSRNTSYQMYIAVQNELTSAFNFLRDKAAKKYYQKSYDTLSEEEKAVIQKVIPFKLSEAEPID